MYKQYWEDYYKKTRRSIPRPSPFAEFVLTTYLRPNNSLIELGCGDGRDSIFFAKNKVSVFAVDQCRKEINYLKNIWTQNIVFQYADFTKLDNKNTYNHVYSRFTMHSISDAEEDATLNWSYNQLNEDGTLFIEARGQENELYKLGSLVPGEQNAYIYGGHYRRFINFDTLCKKLEHIGFQLLTAEEKSGFSPHNDTDYKFIRIIALKGQTKYVK